jgi:ketosteroid isomerase-like protein
MTAEEEKVLEANKDFYHALQSLSLEDMEALWLQEDWVRCLHPGWDMLEGWEAVRESWQQIFESTKFLRVSIGVQSVRLEKGIAWVCCTEKLSSAAEGRFETSQVQATHIFKQQDDGWYLVHRHASHMPTPMNQSSTEIVQ